ncbi:MAG: DUF5667 domain-containing protein [Candidatus Hydrothermarchaeaceae archaeon]
MKFLNIVSIVLVLASLAIQPVFAQEAENGDPGITPDSFLYGLDVVLDKVNLLLTFDQAEKSKKGLEIAEERLLEVRAMALENKVTAMERAANEHDSVLVQVESSIQDLERDNTTSELEEEIEIERKLIEHKNRVEDVQGEIKVKIKVKGVITPEQQELVDSILSSMENKTGKVEIKINNKKGETKIKIKVETGKSDEEIEGEVKRLEKVKGVAGLKLERAADRIEDAIGEIEEAKELLGNETSTLIDEAEEHLSKAESAFDEGRYGEAFGQATAARSIAKAVQEQLEEEELKIEVEIKGGIAKVEVEVDEVEDKFVLNTTDREEIIEAIAERTGLTVDEVRDVMEFEEEDEEDEEAEEELEIKVEITDGTAEVKVEMEGLETKFTLNTTKKDAIIAAISNKTGLSAEEIGNATKWKVKLGKQERSGGRPEEVEEEVEEEAEEEEHEEDEEHVEEEPEEEERREGNVTEEEPEEEEKVEE